MLFLPIQTHATQPTKDASAPAAEPGYTGLYERVYGTEHIDDIYGEIAPSTIRDYVQKFTENGSRYIIEYSMADMGTNLAARKYLMQMFEFLTNGRIEIQLIGNYRNIVAKLPGYLPGDNPAFVISAHYDSNVNSPGANCDGSGIAALLTLADQMSYYEWPLDIYFVAFNGFFGMYPRSGSPEVANWFQTNEIDILSMYNIDTVLVENQAAPSDERIQMGYDAGAAYHVSQYWADLARMISNNYGSNRIVPVPSTSFFLWSMGDQYSFVERGFSQVTCAFESGLAVDGSYQNSNDRWNNVEYNYNLGREITAVIGGCMAYTMGRAYGEVQRQAHNFTIGPGSFQRYYIPITAPTTINVSSRWYGGNSSYLIVDPDFNIIAQQDYLRTSPWEPTSVFNVSVTDPGLYSLVAINTDIRSVGYDLKFSYDGDVDGNGVMDSQEYWLDENLWNSDQDADGLSDAQEITLGTNLQSGDTDLDLMPDKYEIDMGFEPRDPTDAGQDADQDGLTNLQEYLAGLNPFNDDSDSDGMSDLWELENGLNPLVDDSNEDPDGDNLTNLEEFELGTNPLVAESEQLDLSFMWFVAPVVVIAPIVVLLYRRRTLMD
jgi:hypothetical protein